MVNQQLSVENSFILVVEDHDTLRRNLVFLLQVVGFQVIQARSGLEALKQMQQRIPDLILSDTHMPGMNGCELLRRLRESAEWAGVPFIAMPPREAFDDLVAMYDLGADDFVIKPFDIYAVLDSIRRVLPDLAGDLQRRRAG